MKALLPSEPLAAADDSRADAYLALLAKVRRVARWYFRHVPCADRRQDLVAEVVALGWLWFLRLADRQKDPAQFAFVFAYTLARSVHSGRRLCGVEPARDTLSPVCQRTNGFAVAPVPDGSSRIGTLFDDALQNNRPSPIPDQVQFRLDFPRWRKGLPRFKQRLLDVLATGERTRDAAVRFRITPGRISQLRRELHESWAAFCADSGTQPTETD